MLRNWKKKKSKLRLKRKLHLKLQELHLRKSLLPRPQLINLKLNLRLTKLKQKKKKKNRLLPEKIKKRLKKKSQSWLNNQLLESPLLRKNLEPNLLSLRKKLLLRNNQPKAYNKLCLKKSKKSIMLKS